MGSGHRESRVSNSFTTIARVLAAWQCQEYWLAHVGILRLLSRQRKMKGQQTCLPNTSSKQFTSRVSTCLWVAGLSLVNKGRRSLRLKSAVTGPDRPYNTLPWPWKVWKPRILFVIVRQFYVDWEWLATLSWCKILPQMVGDFSFCT